MFPWREGRGEKTLTRHEGHGDSLQKVQHPMNRSPRPRTRGEKEEKKKKEESVIKEILLFSSQEPEPLELRCLNKGLELLGGPGHTAVKLQRR